MKEEFIIVECKYCGELNRVGINIFAFACIKCGKKIVVPSGEKKIKSQKK